MKAFYYTPASVERTEFAPGYFRLGGWETTQDPTEAECFVLPTDIRHVSDRQIMELPYLEGNESRHVFFSLSEFPDRPLPVAEAIGFRTDQSKLLTRFNPRVMTWCWGVEDLARYVAPPAEGFTFDIHAQMWASTPLAEVTTRSCVDAGLRVRKQLNPFFYGTLETAGDARLPELRKTFLESMHRSRLVLVPRSRPGVNRYRFFEAMSMGRIPVLVGDDVELPFPESSTWEDCMIRVHEWEARYIGELLRDWLASVSDEELMERGRAGRAFWEICFKNEAWEQVWGHRVANRLALLPEEVLHGK